MYDDCVFGRSGLIAPLDAESKPPYAPRVPVDKAKFGPKWFPIGFLDPESREHIQIPGRKGTKHNNMYTHPTMARGLLKL